MIFSRYHEKQMKKAVGHFEGQNAPSSTPSILWNALWFLQDRFGSRFQFLKCLVVFARQVRINIPFFAMPWHAWFLQDRFQLVMWPSLDTSKQNACVYTFEQEFSTSLLHMRPIGFKSFYLLHSNVEQDLVTRFKPFPHVLYYFMVENRLYLNVGHW